MECSLRKTARIPELDGLRGIAVSMVLVWHFVGAVIDPALGQWAKFIAQTTIFGRTGVDLFFVLSGFLITGIILDREQKSRIFIANFYIRRILRIVPSYVVLLFIFWAGVLITKGAPAFSADTPPWYHFFFIQNIWMTRHEQWGAGAISVTWSVAIEEQFYIVFPFVALLLSRKNLVRLLIVVAIFSCIFRMAVWLQTRNAFAMYVFTLSRLDGLAAGGLVACFWRSDAFRPFVDKYGKVLCKIFVALLFWLPVFLLSLRKNLPLNMAIWGHSYLTLLYSVALVCILGWLGSEKVSWLRNKTLGKLGSISYTMYLFHPFFISVVFLIAGRDEKLVTSCDLALFCLSLIICLLYSGASFKFIEKPATNFGKRFSY